MQILFLNNKFKIILLISILIIVFYRSPYIFLNGRFVAEEGSFWFRNAFIFGPIKGLTQIFFGSAYINIWPNISSVFASLVPLEYSPLVTVYFAFVVQLYLFIYIIFSQSDFLITNFDKLFLSLIVLLSPPMVPAVWLNTLTSQVYFTILSILIFFQKDNVNNFFTKSSPVILLISGLSSMPTCILSPFFIYKYFKNKNRSNFYNSIAITFSTVCQSFVYIYVKINSLELAGIQLRYNISLEKISNYTYNVLIKSFLGRDLTQTLFYKFLNFINLYILSFFIIILMLFFFKFIFKKIRKDKTLLSLVLFFLIQTCLAIYAAKLDQVQSRYAVIPGVLLIFIIYRIFQISFGALKFFTFSLIMLSLITGSYEYKLNNKYSHYLTCINCPDWKTEVAKWKKDPTYALKIWTYPGKTMYLHPKLYTHAHLGYP